MMNEKNLKKMDECELNMVAGGYQSETVDDSRFLNVLLQGKSGQCGRYGKYRIGSHIREVAAAWKAVGVQAELNNTGEGGRRNEYKIYGYAVTPDRARQHAMNVVGRQLKPSDWQW